MSFDLVNSIIILIMLFTALTFGVLGAWGSYDPERSPPPLTFKAAIRQVALEFAFFAFMLVAYDLVFHRDSFWERQEAMLVAIPVVAVVKLAIYWVLIRRRTASSAA